MVNSACFCYDKMSEILPETLCVQAQFKKNIALDFAEAASHASQRFGTSMLISRVLWTACLLCVSVCWAHR